MEHIKAVDLAMLTATDARARQALFGGESDPDHCTVNCIKTPPGEGSNAGLHSHPVDQVFYLIRGTMTVEIGGEVGDVAAGSVVVFPAGTPHRNWNRGTEPTIHLAINPPLPDPNEPFVRQS